MRLTALSAHRIWPPTEAHEDYFHLIPNARVRLPLPAGIFAVTATRSGGPARPVEVALDGVAACDSLARRLAAIAEAGDVIGLSGELGAGKTTFARAFIAAFAARAGEMADEVPSPTFTLAQIYESAAGVIWHFDLYRLERAEDAFELGIEDAFADGISLIEWPERIAALLPADRLDIELHFTDKPQRRIARLAGRGSWAGRLAKIQVEVVHD